MDRLFLVDGSSYFYRAFFGLRGLATAKGFPTNAIYVFTNMLVKVLRQQRPKHIAIVWDAPGPTFRDALYKEYKANRPPMPDDLSKQIPHIKRIPELFAVPSLEISGGGGRRHRDARAPRQRARPRRGHRHRRQGLHAARQQAGERP